jgi:orotate phosphoribosyltransferase
MGEAAEVLEDAGVVVVQALVLVDRSGGLAADRLAALGVPFVSLLEPSDLGVDT